MEFQLWMLLIFPLFFGMGWLAARIDIKELLSESSALPQSYFQGLNCGRDREERSCNEESYGELRKD